MPWFANCSLRPVFPTMIDSAALEILDTYPDLDELAEELGCPAEQDDVLRKLKRILESDELDTAAWLASWQGRNVRRLLRRSGLQVDAEAPPTELANAWLESRGLGWLQPRCQPHRLMQAIAELLTQFSGIASFPAATIAPLHENFSKVLRTTLLYHVALRQETADSDSFARDLEADFCSSLVSKTVQLGSGQAGDDNDEGALDFLGHERQVLLEMIPILERFENSQLNEADVDMLVKQIGSIIRRWLYAPDLPVVPKGAIVRGNSTDGHLDLVDEHCRGLRLVSSAPLERGNSLLVDSSATSENVAQAAISVPDRPAWSTPGLSHIVTSDPMYDIAVSGRGLHGEFVTEVLDVLKGRGIPESRQYWFQRDEERGSGFDADLELAQIYRYQCKLVVVIACSEYLKSSLCNVEWRVARSLRNVGRGDCVLVMDLDGTRLEGMEDGVDTVVRAQGRRPAELADVILGRLRNVSGFARPAA